MTNASGNGTGDPSEKVTVPVTTELATPRVALVVNPFEVAVIVVDPIATEVAKPWLLTVATLGAEELQEALEVTSCVLPSVKFNTARNCWVDPSGINGVPGVTASDTGVGPVTVRVVEPLIVPEAAAMEVVPAPSVLTKPWLPTTLPISATDPLEELHITPLLKSFVLPSVYAPVAVNCCVFPFAIEGPDGVTVMEVKVFTISEAKLVAPPKVAEIDTFPLPTVVANPWLPEALLTVAIVESDEPHVVLSVTLELVPSSYLA